MIRPMQHLAGISIKSGITAGAVVCYDNSSGVLTPIWTPCSTPYYQEPTPTPGVQWLRCNACTGARLADGGLGNARCDVCFT